MEFRMATRIFLNLRALGCSNGNMSHFIKPCTSDSTTHLASQSLLPRAQSPIINFARNAVSQAVEQHSHSKIWTAERAVSGSLLALIPASVLISHPIADYMLALSLTAHIHWGVEAIVVDYVRPKVFGTVIPKMGVAAVYFLSMMTLGGLFYFNYSDVGLVKAIKMLWRL